jgi:hypothetical protein
VRGSEGVRDDNIGEDRQARNHDVQVRSSAILSAEACRFLGCCCTREVRMVVECVDDGVMAEGDLLTLVAIAGQVMPGVALDRVHESA